MAELITNGDFAADTDWDKGTGWTISGGTATCDGSQVANTVLEPTVAVNATATNDYVVTLTLLGYTAGNLAWRFGSASWNEIVETDRKITWYLTAGNTQKLEIRGDANFAGSVDNVSIKDATFLDPSTRKGTSTSLGMEM